VTKKFRNGYLSVLSTNKFHVEKIEAAIYGIQAIRARGPHHVWRTYFVNHAVFYFQYRILTETKKPLSFFDNG